MGRPFRPRLLARVSLLMLGVATMLVVSAHCDPFRSPNSTVTIFFGYPAVTVGCLAIVTAFLGMKLNTTTLVTRVGVYLGKISYGLYIWHMVALEAAVKGLARPIPFAGEWIYSSSFTAMCALALTIAISATSYRLLETPFLRLKSRFALIPSRPT